MKKHSPEKRYSTVVRRVFDDYIAGRRVAISSRLDAMLSEKLGLAGEKPVEKVEKKKSRSFFEQAFFSVTLRVLVATIFIFVGVTSFRPSLLLGIIPLYATPSPEISFNISKLASTVRGEESAGQIKIVMDKKVNAITAKAAISVTPAVAYDVKISENKQEMIITPKEALPEGQTMKVSVKQGLLFEDGTYLAEEKTLTVPSESSYEVIKTTPQNNEVTAYDSAVTIEFKEPFPLEKAKERVSFSPSVVGDFSQNENTITFLPKTGFIPNTTYTMSISNARSVASSPQESSVTVTFEALEVAEKTPYSGDHIGFNSWKEEYTPAGIEILSKGVQKALLDVYQIDIAALRKLAIAKALPQATLWHDAIKDLSPVQTHVLEISSSKQALKLSELSTGFYVVRVAGTETTKHETFEVLAVSPQKVGMTLSKEGDLAITQNGESAQDSGITVVILCNEKTLVCAEQSLIRDDNSKTQFPLKENESLIVIYQSDQGVGVELFSGTRYNQ